MKVAVSGHRGLNDQTTALVDDAIRAHLATVDSDLVGVSCLADGADQIFARAVLDHGGDLVVVIPALEYRDGLPELVHESYDELLTAAKDVQQLDFTESTSESHMAASERMLDMADELIAVWDGRPARGFGGTADVVTTARSRGIQVVRVWPDGAERD